jgi:hypothetical protein
VRQDAPFAGEGGLIHIESMLSSTVLRSELESHETAAEVLAETGFGESDEHSNTVGLASDGGPISNEMARAMAFELAGEEPAQLRRAAPIHDHDVSPTPAGKAGPTTREPLSTAGEAAGSAPDEFAAAKPPLGTMDGEQITTVAGALGEFAGRQQGVHRTEVRPVAWNPGTTVAHGAMILDAATALEAAQAGVFEELAADELAARSSLALEFSWRGALSATPLLMILALERITAGSSRRAGRDDRSPAAVPLRRPADTRARKA